LPPHPSSAGSDGSLSITFTASSQPLYRPADARHAREVIGGYKHCFSDGDQVESGWLFRGCYRDETCIVYTPMDKAVRRDSIQLRNNDV
jgi:hypothetical protein